MQAGIEESKARIYGILVTYRRPAALEAMLGHLACQDIKLECLLLVDNGPCVSNEAAAQKFMDSGNSVSYMPLTQNLGPAGAISHGLRRVLGMGRDDDWVVLLDDDDPPPDNKLIGSLFTFGRQMYEEDLLTAGVGVGGARFDRKRGRLLRLEDTELEAPAVPVDCIGGGLFPLYRVGAVRSVGLFNEELFFGYEELEFGLRLRGAGYSLYTNGPLRMRSRVRAHRAGIDVKPRIRLGNPSWRDYYGLRNLVFLLRKAGLTSTAIRITVIAGVVKPLLNIPMAPIRSLKHLILKLRACRDGWMSRMGRTIDPPLDQLKPVRRR